MPRNVEIKARLGDFEMARRKAEAICGTCGEAIRQEDLFFNSHEGRLKLRIIDRTRGELIHYDRPDSTTAKLSEYEIFRTDCPADLLAVLSASLGATTIVRKERLLFIHEKTRIHLDRVEGLGEFIEFEVMLENHENETSGYETARRMMSIFNVTDEDLIDCAYADLLNR